MVHVCAAVATEFCYKNSLQEPGAAETSYEFNCLEDC